MTTILEIRSNSLKVKMNNQITLIASYKDEKGIYFFNENLKKQYVYFTPRIETIEEIALEFSKELLKELGNEDFKKMVKLSKANTDPMICVSHDFCDANMPMLEAYERVLDYEPQANNEAHNKIWSDAWTLAVKNDFFDLCMDSLKPQKNRELKTFTFDVEYEHKGRLNGFDHKVTTIKAKSYDIALEKVRNNFKTIYDISEI